MIVSQPYKRWNRKILSYPVTQRFRFPNSGSVLELRLVSNLISIRGLRFYFILTGFFNSSVPDNIFVLVPAKMAFFSLCISLITHTIKIKEKLRLKCLTFNEFSIFKIRIGYSKDRISQIFIRFYWTPLAKSAWKDARPLFGLVFHEKLDPETIFVNFRV